MSVFLDAGVAFTYSSIVSSETGGRELPEEDRRPPTSASRPRGHGAVVLILIGLVAAAASVLTGGISGPVVLHHVREHLTAVCLVLVMFSFIGTRIGLRAEGALAGALLACAIGLVGMYSAVTVERQVPQQGPGARAMIVHKAGVLDGDVCVVVQSGGAPWSWQESVLCRSEDDPEGTVAEAGWAAPNTLRIIFGDGSQLDHVVD